MAAPAEGILGRGAFRQVDVHVVLLERFRLYPRLVARLRTTVRAASMDSFITSPNWPVR